MIIWPIELIGNFRRGPALSRALRPCSPVPRWFFQPLLIAAPCAWRRTSPGIVDRQIEQANQGILGNSSWDANCLTQLSHLGSIGWLNLLDEILALHLSLFNTLKSPALSGLFLGLLLACIPSLALAQAADVGTSKDNFQQMLEIEEHLRLAGKKASFSNVQKVLRGELKLPSKAELLSRENTMTKGHAVVKDYVYKNGDRYTGEVLDGRRHGQGSYYWKDGGHYTGTWVKGKREGKGRLVTKSDGVYVGEFRDSKIQGSGTYETEEGDIYSGTFHGSLGEGEGTFTAKGGRPAKAKWSDGRVALAARQADERTFGRLTPEARARAEAKVEGRRYRTRDKNGRKDNGRKSLYLVTWGAEDSIDPGELYPDRAQSAVATRRRVDQYLLYRFRGRNNRRCHLVGSGVTVDEYRIKQGSFDRFYARLKRVEDRNSGINGDTLFLGEITAKKKARRVAEGLARTGDWKGWSVMSVKNKRDLPTRCSYKSMKRQ